MVICMYVCIYIYIYTEREKERETERELDRYIDRETDRQVDRSANPPEATKDALAEPWSWRSLKSPGRLMFALWVGRQIPTNSRFLSDP